MALQPAKISFNLEGTPVANDFDDVYFSNQNGLEESRYVFIHHNNLIERWQGPDSNHFVIAETGFGTGLNFLATWQAFSAAVTNKPSSSNSSTTLHFISVEKFPLVKGDLVAALAKWPELSAYSSQLTAQYPDLIEGCHRLVFDNGAVILDLWFGDAEEVFAHTHNFKHGLVDAWFLDGFAPSKNPEMWNPNLFEQMARLTKVSGTFATFTAAGFVKRGLAEQGFTVKKVKGFGKKREMIVGELTKQDIHRNTEQYFYRNALNHSGLSTSVAVIGAGIAGANLALSLVQRGCKVTLFCQEEKVAQGASGNPQGGFYPQLNAQLNITSHLQALAFGFAKRRYQVLLDNGFLYAHQWCGVMMLAFKHQVLERQRNLLQKGIWPESLIRPLSPAESSKIAGLELPHQSLFVEQGGWINPPQLVEQTIKYAQSLGDCEVLTGHHVENSALRYSAKNAKWNLSFKHEELQFDCVVMATGSHSKQLDPLKDLPFNLVRGQVEAVPSMPPLSHLKTVLCHKGYLTPQFEGSHALGSTYVKRDDNTDYRLEEQETNFATHQTSLSQTYWAKKVEGNGAGRAAIRCGLPDHLPALGAVFDSEHQSKQFANMYKALPLQSYPIAEDTPGLYVFAGLGSRGLTTAPLMAELLASQITHQPLPLPNRLLRALNPNRFLIKQLIRQQ